MVFSLHQLGLGWRAKSLRPKYRGLSTRAPENQRPSNRRHPCRPDKTVASETRLEFFQGAWWCVRFFPPGWEARRYSRAETTPRPAYRVEGEATAARARPEGVTQCREAANKNSPDRKCLIWRVIGFTARIDDG